MKTIIKNRFLLLSMIISLSSVNIFSQSPKSNTNTEIKYLSGKGYDDAVEWDFFCTEGRNSGEWTKINVPSCWEQQGFGEYNYGIYFYAMKSHPAIPTEQGKYKHNFMVPKEWEDKNVQIVFEASMTDTEVRINGKKAGPTHQGAFYRFKYDITPWLKFGKENLLEVTVSEESKDISVNLAERRADYWNFGGIFRPVFLEVRPAHNIDRTAVAAEANGDFLAEVFLGHPLSNEYSVKAEVLDLNGKSIGKPVIEKPKSGSEKVVLKSHFDNVDLWTAETPNLYNVRFTLMKDGKAVHTVNDRIGFRTFEIRKKDGLYLNGKRIMMRGVNRHSFWPETGRTLNKELNYNDVRLIKEMNMNTVRMSHYPPDPEFLDACDELGLYVLNELGGWHGHYDTGIGRKLVKETVTRDVNHPSIVFWDNGNEKGWNTELDCEFAKWDPQNRPVIHPQQDLNGMETMHYRSYGETQNYLRGKDLFMPTEFLHGLYDGGHGAGLYDYWKMMYNHPNCTGGLLWVYADEGVVRTDQDGKIDNDGNHGADGIVGPHHEKEGSFFTIKEVWSPVYIDFDELPADFSGAIPVQNRYDFINLNQCKFTWKISQFSDAFEKNATEKTIKEGKFNGPDLKAHAKGELNIPLPKDWKNADALFVTAYGPEGEEIYTWSWDLAKQATSIEPTKVNNEFKTQETDKNVTISVGGNAFTFSKEKGELLNVKQNGKTISFGNGPKFTAARRGDRSLDGWVAENLPNPLNGIDRVYNEFSTDSTLTFFDFQQEDGYYAVNAKYAGALKNVLWKIYPDGLLELDYTYQYDGVVELMGIKFDYPEDNMKSIKWLGMGPYRSWQNRTHGTELGIWGNDYNDPIPGESFVYPEFKGYFRDWQWANFSTTEGTISIANKTFDNYLGVYTPRDGRDALLYTLPQTGISVLDVIPAVRNKVNATDLCGPSSQAQRVSGEKSGTVYFRFQAK